MGMFGTSFVRFRIVVVGWEGCMVRVGRLCGLAEGVLAGVAGWYCQCLYVKRDEEWCDLT